jgi:hypothetical protein
MRLLTPPLVIVVRDIRMSGKDRLHDASLDAASFPMHYAERMDSPTQTGRDILQHYLASLPGRKHVQVQGPIYGVLERFVVFMVGHVIFRAVFLYRKAVGLSGQDVSWLCITRRPPHQAARRSLISGCNPKGLFT